MWISGFFEFHVSDRFGYRAHPVYTFGECETSLGRFGAGLSSWCGVPSTFCQTFLNSIQITSVSCDIAAIFWELLKVLYIHWSARVAHEIGFLDLGK